MQRKRCPKCGITKSVSEFHAKKEAADGLQHSCKQCRGQLDVNDVSTLDHPDRVTTRTFWRIWRNSSLAHVRKFVEKDVQSPIEQSMVDSIVQETEEELLELCANVNRKLKRIKTWRNSIAQAQEQTIRRKIREAHNTLEIPIPRKRDPSPITDIKKAYRTKARATHPDLVEGRGEDFEMYTRAYNALMNYYEEANGDKEKS